MYGALTVNVQVCQGGEDANKPETVQPALETPLAYTQPTVSTLSVISQPLTPDRQPDGNAAPQTMGVENTDAIIRLTYAFGGQAVVTRITGDPNSNNNGVFYIHSDHLGSTTALSNGAGVGVAGSATRYAPFGSYRGTPPTQTLTNRDFTSQKHNRDLGLIYYNARYYAPGFGRFISADTIIPTPQNPQSFNRYSYTRNNPINFTDPTGHREEDCDLGLCDNEDTSSGSTSSQSSGTSQSAPSCDDVWCARGPYHPEISLEDWEKGLLAAIIIQENNGQPVEFFNWSAWVLRNRYESGKWGNSVVDVVFSQGQYTSVQTWFSKHPDVVAWLQSYPNGEGFTATEIAERFSATIMNSFSEQYALAYEEVESVFGQSFVQNPVPGGLYVGHVATNLAYLEEDRLSSQGAVFYRFDGANNRTIIVTNDSSACCYQK